MEKPTDRPGGLRLPVACSVLVLAIALAGALGGSIAHAQQGLIGSAAVAVAALTCGLSATAALLVAGVLAGTRFGVHGILAASLVRFSLPLAVVVAAVAVKGPLARAGLGWYMVVYFLFALVVETLLLVGVLRSTTPADSVAWRGR